MSDSLPGRQRTPEEIAQDVRRGRERLAESLDDLQQGIDRAAEESRVRVDQVAATTRRAAPFVAGAAVTIFVGGALLRRRARRLYRRD